MTAIAIWLNNESNHPSLWVVADTLVSGQRQSILMEDATKIIGLPVVCRTPDADGFFTKISFNYSYGYCYAGSTLIGQNAYLTLQPLLGNLIAAEGYIPAFADIAQYVWNYLFHIFEENKLRGTVFEIAIFGYCFRTNTYSTYHFRTEVVAGIVKLICKQHVNMQENNYVYLGDERERMEALLSDGFLIESVPGRQNDRMPRHIIEGCIVDESLPTIGGDIQLGIVNTTGFRPFTIVRPRPNSGPAYLTYLGRELTNDLAYLGEAKIGTNGMC